MGYGTGIIKRLSSNVIKWWQQVVMPVFVIRYDENRAVGTTVNAEEKPETTKDSTSKVQDMAGNAALDHTVSADEQDVTDGRPGVTTGDIDYAVRKAAELNDNQEIARQREIERLRREQQEKERIAAIMNANKVNVNAFIEAGREAKQHDEEVREAEKKAAQEAENLRRAQEIMDRLNREAAEDEAKKEAEIAEAKAQMGY